jgi:hypothetical protein
VTTEQVFTRIDQLCEAYQKRRREADRMANHVEATHLTYMWHELSQFVNVLRTQHAADGAVSPLEELDLK